VSVGLRTSCPHCGRDTALSETLFGSTVRCPSCFREFPFESVSFAGGEAGDRGRRWIGKQETGPPIATRAPTPRGRPSATEEPRPVLGTIGRFELRERVGQGTFGVVFRAFDPVLDREVAVKVPQVSFADDRAARRFLAEAKAAARLRHPGIVAVHEAGIADGRPYIATQFVNGQTLADRLKAARPPVDLAVSWVRDLARALSYAHSEGVVHRDVKPGNVMLDEHDRPQLMDFGLARHRDSDSSLTTEGSLLGTPAYMSPEQARGETAAVGPKSDQYALGVVLYELLGGARPFVGPPHAVVTQVASAEDPPPLRSRDPSLPRDLESICRKAMEKDPARRYDDAAALADDLGRWLLGEETLARPLGILERGRRWTRRSPAVASLIAAVAATAAVGFGAVLSQWRQAESRRRDAQRHLGEARIAQKQKEGLLAEKQGLLTEVERQRDAAQKALATAERRSRELKAALDESNSNLAEATRQRTRADAAGAEAARLSDRVVGEQAEADRQRAEAARLAARRDLERAQELADANEVPEAVLAAARALASLPAGSEDSEWHLRMQLALLRRFLHEPVRMIETGRPVRAVDVDPTGLLVATGDAGGTLKVWSAERGAEALPKRGFDGPVRVVRFAPAEKQLLVCAGSAVELIRIGDDAEPRPLRHPASVLSGAFDGEGRKIATGGEDRLARVWTTAAARLAFPPLEHEGPVRAVALSPDGKLLLTGTGAPVRRVALWDADAGRSIAVLHDGSADVAGVAFSADGQLMAAGTADGVVRFWRTADRAPSRRSLKVEAPVRSLAFTPAGRLLVAASDGAARLWDVEVGKAEGQPLTHAGAVTAVACERSGQGLLTGGEDGVVKLWRSAGAKSVEGVIPHEAAVPKVALSSDGELLATGDVKGVIRLFDLARGMAIGEPLPLAGAVTALAFGDGVVAVGADDGTARLVSAETAKPIGQRMRHENALTALSFSADRRLLLSVERDGPARLWEAGTGKPVGQPLALEGRVGAAAIGPDGSVVAAGGPGTLRFWSTKGEPTSEPLAISGRVASLAFSEDGRFLLAGTESGDVTRWDVKAGRRLDPAFSHGGPLHTVLFGPDGRLAVTAGPGRDVRLWDTETGQPFGSPLSHGDDVTALRFREDGRFLVTATKAGDVLFWDAVLGRRVGLPLRAAGPVIDLAASADDAVLAVAAGVGPPRVWKVSPPVLTAPETVVAWAEVVTGLAADGEQTAPLDPRQWEERRRRIENGAAPAAEAGER